MEVMALIEGQGRQIIDASSDSTLHLILPLVISVLRGRHRCQALLFIMMPLLRPRIVPSLVLTPLPSPRIPLCRQALGRNGAPPPPTSPLICYRLLAAMELRLFTHEARADESRARIERLEDAAAESTSTQVRRGELRTLVCV